jgi:hypothetical protein
MSFEHLHVCLVVTSHLWWDVEGETQTRRAELPCHIFWDVEFATFSLACLKFTRKQNINYTARQDLFLIPSLALKTQTPPHSNKAVRKPGCLVPVLSFLKGVVDAKYKSYILQGGN